MRLSLVIPTRAQAKLKPCLDAIVKHTDDYELIIVEGDDGFTAKINRGIKQAKGDYIVLLHDDCIVTKGWADELAEVGSFCLGELNDKFDSWGGFINPPGYCGDPRLSPDYSYFCCMSKEAAEKIGPFDEKFTEPMFQDVHMGILTRKAGYKYKCLPGKIIHRCSDKSGQPNEKQRFYLERKYGVKL